MTALTFKCHIILMNRLPHIKTWSLPSLLQVVKDGSLTSGEFQVGGHLSFNGRSLCLKGGGGSIEISHSSDRLKLELDQGLIYLAIVNLKLELSTAAEAVFHLERVTELKPLVPEKRRYFVDSHVKLESVELWQQFLKATHDFFQSEQFLHVETPSLTDCPGMEPTLDPIQANTIPLGSEFETYLPTSPELSLKKFVAAHCADVYEVRKCFRDKELTPWHEPEFTMMEWYRTFDDVSGLIDTFKRWMQALQLGLAGTRKMPDLKVISVREAFQGALGETLNPKVDLPDLQQMFLRNNLEFSESDQFEDLISRLLVEKIEPWLLQQGTAIALVDYPQKMAALSRIDSEGWAQRVEIYWEGVELANGFDELTDGEEQRKRFQQDNHSRVAMGRSPLAGDEAFLRALDWGLPPCAGIAVGLDRVFMQLFELENIKKANPFNWSWRIQSKDF